MFLPNFLNKSTSHACAFSHRSEDAVVCLFTVIAIDTSRVDRRSPVPVETRANAAV